MDVMSVSWPKDQRLSKNQHLHLFLVLLPLFPSSVATTAFSPRKRKFSSLSVTHDFYGCFDSSRDIKTRCKAEFFLPILKSKVLKSERDEKIEFDEDDDRNSHQMQSWWLCLMGISRREEVRERPTQSCFLDCESCHVDMTWKCQKQKQQSALDARITADCCLDSNCSQEGGGQSLSLSSSWSSEESVAKSVPAAKRLFFHSCNCWPLMA